MAEAASLLSDGHVAAYWSGVDTLVVAEAASLLSDGHVMEDLTAIIGRGWPRPLLC